MSSTFKKFNLTKIGSVGLRGPGVIGYISLKVNSLTTLFCRIDILSRSAGADLGFSKGGE